MHLTNRAGLENALLIYCIIIIVIIIMPLWTGTWWQWRGKTTFNQAEIMEHIETERGGHYKERERRQATVGFFFKGGRFKSLILYSLSLFS